ncbi:hypothetical protein [Lyngbya sp. PCC 8106]|uniref:hypothetical protein n=1 Tax=Lyngbya sp. (strain PCC 8106) TaxID=313612 RepID=UPI0000EA8CAB|nr:hypothetical protein [Lyngbya sp. PCC 8106]EAW36232.1 hypothetical protein L8106_22921 [Lyngbya sp. PCC 8106]
MHENQVFAEGKAVKSNEEGSTNKTFFGLAIFFKKTKIHSFLLIVLILSSVMVLNACHQESDDSPDSNDCKENEKTC